MIRDPEERAMLGLRPMKELEDDFLAAIKSAAELGLSARQYAKQRRDVDVLEWMYVGGLLLAKGKVRSEWRPLKQPDLAVQESVYYAT
jgi:hypothetical protein